MMILDPRIAILDLMKNGQKSSRQRKDRLPAFVSRQVNRSQRYFLDLSPSRRQPLAVACGGYEEVRGDYVIARDDFPYYCIEFVTAGQGRLWLGDAATAPVAEQALSLTAGTLFTYGPGVAHRIETERRSRLRKHYVDFAGRRAATQLQAVGLTAGSWLRVSHAEEVAEIFDLMLRCGLPQSAHSDGLCSQLLGVLLAKVRQRRLPEAADDPRALATYEQLRELLSSRCVEWQSVEAASAACGISPAYACRLFARFGEHSPYQYLVRQRMSLAAEWLGSEQLLVKDVAARLGYPDQYQFSRSFKRVFGVSPAAFRRGQSLGTR
ncbi:MAG: AraC family transcriptional regulator [Planctomycetia bacterium]|nr:AraC family transcriptional regulator [Planctomycetia bacterium]